MRLSIRGFGYQLSMSNMDLRAGSFADHEPIPSRHLKENEDLSPPLRWSQPPVGTVELALVCVDPDAPNGTFVHWLVAGIDPSSDQCDEGKPPPGAIEGRNDFGDVAYGGPRPPVGDKPHRYFFKIHALNEALGLREGFSYDELQRHLAGAEIGMGTVVGTCQRL